MLILDSITESLSLPFIKALIEILIYLEQKCRFLGNLEQQQSWGHTAIRMDIKGAVFGRKRNQDKVDAKESQESGVGRVGGSRL